MKTNLITIALTTLITFNVNAAFLFQAHTPSGVVVMEGEKVSEVPVEQEAAQPQQPQLPNWIPSNYKNGFGYYENMPCFGQEGNRFAEGDGDIVLVRNGSEVDYNTLKIGSIGSNSFYYQDVNGNDTRDAGEARYFIGQSFTITSEGVTTTSAQLCGSGLVDTPTVNSTFNESVFSQLHPEKPNFGHYSNQDCQVDVEDHFKYVIDQNGDMSAFSDYDHYKVDGTVMGSDFWKEGSDSNNNSFIYRDDNENFVYDQNEFKFYIGDLISSGTETITNLFGSHTYTVEKYQVCR